MKSTFVISTLILCTSCTTVQREHRNPNVPVEAACEQIREGTLLLDSGVTLRDAEAAGRIDALNGTSTPDRVKTAGPQWDAFKEGVKPLDVIYSFSYSEVLDGKPWAFGGLIALRGKCITGMYRRWVT